MPRARTAALLEEVLGAAALARARAHDPRPRAGSAVLRGGAGRRAPRRGAAAARPHRARARGGQRGDRAGDRARRRSAAHRRALDGRAAPPPRWPRSRASASSLETCCSSPARRGPASCSRPASPSRRRGRRGHVPPRARARSALPRRALAAAPLPPPRAGERLEAARAPPGVEVAPPLARRPRGRSARGVHLLRAASESGRARLPRRRRDGPPGARALARGRRTR